MNGRLDCQSSTETCCNYLAQTAKAQAAPPVFRPCPPNTIQHVSSHHPKPQYSVAPTLPVAPVTPHSTHTPAAPAWTPTVLQIRCQPSLWQPLPHPGHPMPPARHQIPEAGLGRGARPPQRTAHSPAPGRQPGQCRHWQLEGRSRPSSDMQGRQVTGSLLHVSNRVYAHDSSA